MILIVVDDLIVTDWCAFVIWQTDAFSLFPAALFFGCRSGARRGENHVSGFFREFNEQTHIIGLARGYTLGRIGDAYRADEFSKAARGSNCQGTVDGVLEAVTTWGVFLGTKK
jgi:hypothetical protein